MTSGSIENALPHDFEDDLQPYGTVPDIDADEFMNTFNEIVVNIQYILKNIDE
jgi:hypothetical protein